MRPAGGPGSIALRTSSDQRAARMKSISVRSGSGRARVVVLGRRIPTSISTVNFSISHNHGPICLIEFSPATTVGLIT
jgi:hypothetical protein